jgi:predicted deacylase
MSPSLPVIDVVAAARPGPIVGILGGVHGDEYEGVLTANVLRRELGATLLCGEVRIAAPAHPAAWSARTRGSLHDGTNLARVFPGAPDGGPTEQIAHLLTQRVIDGVDLLIDLHSAGATFEMPLLCGYHEGDDHRGTVSRRCADAFAAHFTWVHDAAPAPGRSVSAAYALDVPAIYVESRGGLTVRADDLDAYLDGVRRVLHELGMLGEAPAALRRPVRVRGDGDTDAGIVAPVGGYVVVNCDIGAHRRRGELIATILLLDGTRAAEIMSPLTGYVMLLRRDAHVVTGDTVCIVAASEDSRD